METVWILIDEEKNKILKVCNSIESYIDWLVEKKYDLEHVTARAYPVYDSSKQIMIYVNGQKKEWTLPTITYNELVLLADKKLGSLYTIMYSRGFAEDKEGMLFGHKNVKVKNGMVFDVTITSGV